MRLLGINIPENKRIEIGLTAVYGIGRPRALSILKKSKIDPSLKPKDISVDQENEIRKVIESMKLEGDLKREVAGNIKRLKDIKAYRGVRHMKVLPVRGQQWVQGAR